MERNPSDASNNLTPSKLRSFGSAIRRIGSGSKRKAKGGFGSFGSVASIPSSPLDEEPPVQKFVQELDAVETVPRHPTSPVLDPAEPVRATNPTFTALQAAVQSLQVETEVSVKLHGWESGYTVYAEVRAQILRLCKELVRDSQINGLHTFAGSMSSMGLDSLWHRQSTYDTWYTTIRDFRAYLEDLLSAMHKALVTTYKSYRPDATAQQLELLFREKSFRDAEIRWMRNSGISVPGHEPAPFWFDYIEGFRNYQRLQHDLDLVDYLLTSARSGKNTDVEIREYNIAPKGDTLLEFSNSMSPQHPVLLFRVSSSILEAASPYFAQALSASYTDSGLRNHIPPTPTKRLCDDGIEVTVYRMPQLELNKWDSLTILLSAAHHQYDKVPRQVKYHEFVSIAEVCLRYQCTSPLEMSVEHRWLPQWLHKANDEHPDGFLLISYCFGLTQLFKRTSKTAILNITDYEELQSKDLWPQDIKDKINAVREAKLAQVYAACVAAVEEYFKPPQARVDPDTVPFNLTSVARCPRGSRQCDATNLGWLMLMFNELEIMPQIMTMVGGRQPSPPPRRSLRELMEVLRNVRGAPQVHSGICDHAASLRTTMHDIYNSIVGLTFWDAAGKGGWALSKDHGETFGMTNENGAEVFELPASISSQVARPVFSRNESITLRILLHLDNIEDLHSAAQINKGFYTVYKKHELSLIKAVARSHRRSSSRISSLLTPHMQHAIPFTQTQLQDSIWREPRRPNFDGTEPETSPSGVQPLIAVAAGQSPMSVAPVSERHSHQQKMVGFNQYSGPEASDDDTFNFSTPQSPVISTNETSDAVSIALWSVEDSTEPGLSDSIEEDFAEQLDPDYNSKFLPTDRDYVDKSLVVESKKHLRSEVDQNLRQGCGSSTSTTPP